MSQRVLMGKRNNGTFGLDVSKPGFDVMTANLLQLAFSSNYIAPVKVISGAFVSSPTSDVAPSGKGVYPGAAETRSIIYYGRSISPSPILYAIATAPGWNVPLVEAPTAQLGYLAGQWHSYIFETGPVSGTANDNTYGPTIGRAAGSPAANQVPFSWASAKFRGYAYDDRIEFVTNCNNSVTIKYLVMES